MKDAMNENFLEAIVIAQDAFERVEEVKEDIYRMIYAEYSIPPEVDSEVTMMVENMFQFTNCGGMVVSQPGAPEPEDIIAFLEKYK